MNRDTRIFILLLGILLNGLCVFALWFSIFGVPIDSPSHIPPEYWYEVHRQVARKSLVVGVPLIFGLCVWSVFAWRLVRGMNRMEALGEENGGQTETDA